MLGGHPEEVGPHREAGTRFDIDHVRYRNRSTPRRQRRGDTGRRVLDSDTVGGIDTEQSGSTEVGVRSGLAALDLVSGDRSCEHAVGRCIQERGATPFREVANAIGASFLCSSE